MGLIRKTLSITTLGLVGWRSKAELLAEAEAELAATDDRLRATAAALDAAGSERASLAEQLAAARADAERAELLAVKEARRARRKVWLEGVRVGHRGVRGNLERVAAPVVRSVVESATEARDRVASEVEPRVEPLVEQAEAGGRRARREAEARASALARAAEARARKAADAAGSGGRRLRAAAERTAHDLQERTGDALDAARGATRSKRSVGARVRARASSLRR